MPKDKKDYNEIELKTIAALRAEGHDNFEEIVGPLRRRMREQTGQETRQTPWLVRIAVVLSALAAVGILFFVKYTS